MNEDFPLEGNTEAEVELSRVGAVTRGQDAALLRSPRPDRFPTALHLL